MDLSFPGFLDEEQAAALGLALSAGVALLGGPPERTSPVAAAFAVLEAVRLAPRRAGLGRELTSVLAAPDPEEAGAAMALVRSAASAAGVELVEDRLVHPVRLVVPASESGGDGCRVLASPYEGDAVRADALSFVRAAEALHWEPGRLVEYGRYKALRRHVRAGGRALVAVGEPSRDRGFSPYLRRGLAADGVEFAELRVR